MCIRDRVNTAAPAAHLRENAEETRASDLQALITQNIDFYGADAEDEDDFDE